MEGVLFYIHVSYEELESAYSTRQHLRIRQLKGSGWIIRRKQERDLFCTDNRVGHTLPYIRTPAWPEMIDSQLVSRTVLLQLQLPKLMKIISISLRRPRVLCKRIAI